jgi:ABC-type sugar transport system ATPase subunit
MTDDPSELTDAMVSDSTQVHDAQQRVQAEDLEDRQRRGVSLCRAAETANNLAILVNDELTMALEERSDQVL